MIIYFYFAIIFAILFYQYRISYFKGLCGSLFFLVLAPKNLAIQISLAMPTITIHRAILILMIFMWFRNSSIRMKSKNIPFFKNLLFIVICLCISLLNSNNFLVSVKQYLYFVFETFIFYLIVSTSISDEEQIIPIIKAIVSGLIVVAIIGIIEKYTHFNPSDHLTGQYFRYDFEKVFRGRNDIESTYLHRILFGVAMAFGTIYNILLIEREKQLNKKILLCVSLCMFWAGLYFSQSRGPWISFMIAMIFISIVDRKKIAKTAMLVFFIISISFVFKPGALDSVKRLYYSSYDPTTGRGSNVSWRLQVLKMAYQKVSVSGDIIEFLFGYGQGSHLFLEFPLVQTTTGHVTQYASWDNENAIMLLERGWVGIILIIGLYYNIFKMSMQKYFKSDNDKKNIILIALAGQIIIISMKYGVAFFAPQLPYLEFINIAILGKLTSK